MWESVWVCQSTRTCVHAHTHRYGRTRTERERERETDRQTDTHTHTHTHTHKDNVDEVTCLVLIGGQNFPPSSKKETLHLARFVPTVNGCTCRRQRAQCVNARVAALVSYTLLH